MSTLSKSAAADQVADSQSITITVDDRPLVARPGQTVAAALMAAGWKAWRRSLRGHPRGVFCGIGVCYDCLVTINGEPNVRACQTPVAEGMVVETSLKPEVVP